MPHPLLESRLMRYIALSRPDHVDLPTRLDRWKVSSAAVHNVLCRALIVVSWRLVHAYGWNRMQYDSKVSMVGYHQDAETMYATGTAGGHSHRQQVFKIPIKFLLSGRSCWGVFHLIWSTIRREHASIREASRQLLRRSITLPRTMPQPAVVATTLRSPKHPREESEYDEEGDSPRTIRRTAGPYASRTPLATSGRSRPPSC